MIPFRHGTTGGGREEKRDAGKNREGEHIGGRCSKENGCFGTFFFFSIIVAGRIFDYFRGLEMIPCFGYLGIGNSYEFDYSRYIYIFFFFLVSQS